jgi:signal transduction histidine kinase
MKRVVPTVRIWVAVAALAIAAAFLLSYRSIRQNQVSIAAMEHTRQTLSALIALEGAVADVIFASGDDGITRATAAARARLDTLSALTVDNPRQQERLVRLGHEIDTVATTRREGMRTGLDPRPEALVPQSLARTLQEFRLEEVPLLTARVQASDVVSRRLTRILIAVGMGSAVLLAWVFGLVVHDERHRRQAEELLRRTNEDLDARVSTRTTELYKALGREQSLRRNAEATSRLKDEFLMTVSHELRTPLNALLGWADMLRLGIVSEAHRQRAVDVIYQNAKLQTQLIGDLLDTSRILTGKLRIEPAFVDFGRIVQDATQVLAPAAAAKGLELTVDVDGHGCVVFGDAVRLQQVVGNLVNGVGAAVAKRLREPPAARRGRHRRRDRSHVSAVCLRSIQPGKNRDRPSVRRPRARTGHCAAARRVARRHCARAQRGRRAGRRVSCEPSDGVKSHGRDRTAGPGGHRGRPHAAGCRPQDAGP